MEETNDGQGFREGGRRRATLRAESGAVSGRLAEWDPSRVPFWWGKTRVPEALGRLSVANREVVGRRWYVRHTEERAHAHRQASRERRPPTHELSAIGGGLLTTESWRLWLSRLRGRSTCLLCFRGPVCLAVCAMPLSALLSILSIACLLVPLWAQKLVCQLVGLTMPPSVCRSARQLRDSGATTQPIECLRRATQDPANSRLTLGRLQKANPKSFGG
ncbi:unnamed protein product [Protopolystoma xenopodis]|uniref:Uncharacterized protein n=1 Tax=Protopolystoma xenopodis TaxID=117903 RepID=A0A3S5A2N9_9PLAT|nr:unnamed protein product [Protopolystoma xenopodis]